MSARHARLRRPRRLPRPAHPRETPGFKRTKGLNPAPSDHRRKAVAAMGDFSHRATIQHAVWLYLRFTLSYRGIEELLAERGLDISYETVRCWVLKFGPVIARRLRRCRPQPSNRWHLDESAPRTHDQQRECGAA